LLSSAYIFYKLVIEKPQPPPATPVTIVQPPDTIPRPVKKKKSLIEPGILTDGMIPIWEEARTIANTATSWKTIYDKVSEHIHSESEHKYGHPEGYSLLVLAAARAIRDGDNMEMHERMRQDLDQKTETSKLAKGHHHWEEVESALRKRDMAALEHVISEVYENWKAILDGTGVLDEHPEEDHGH
jgi:hypothetical protein